MVEDNDDSSITAAGAARERAIKVDAYAIERASGAWQWLQQTGRAARCRLSLLTGGTRANVVTYKIVHLTPVVLLTKAIIGFQDTSMGRLGISVMTSTNFGAEVSCDDK